MLVLSRRIGESVVIGEDVVVTVLEVRGDVVRVGVDAPRSVQVRRRELVEEVAATNRSAASPDPAAVAGLSALVRRPGAPAAASEPTDPTAPTDPPAPTD